MAGVIALAVVAVSGLAQPLTLVQFVPFFVVLACLAALSPTGACAAVIVTLPYFYHPISIGNGQFAPSEILLAAAVTGSSGMLAVRLVDGSRTPRDVTNLLTHTVRSRTVLFATVIAFVGIVAVFFGFDPAARAASLREWRWSLLEPLILVGLLTAFATMRNSRVIMASSLLVAGLVAALHGIADLVMDGGVAADNVRRVSGPLPHPNALALFLVKPLVLGAVLTALSPVWRRWALVPMLLIGLMLFSAFSRGAMLAVAAAALIVALYVSRRSVVAVGVVVAGITGIAMLVARERMLNALDGGSVSLRLDIWSSALRMIRDEPVLGYGPDQFLYAYAPRYIEPTAWDERFTSHAHNLVLDSWIRLGVAGAVMAIAAMILIAAYLGKRGAGADRQDVLRYGALIALAATIVHGLVDNAYFAHDLAMSSWLLAWLGFSSPDNSGRPPT